MVVFVVEDGVDNFEACLEHVALLVALLVVLVVVLGFVLVVVGVVVV